MHSPSPQLLRALRSAANVTTYSSRHIAQCSSSQLKPCLNSRRALSISSARSAGTPVRFSPRPATRDRGPKSDEDTQTDFGAMDMLGNIRIPATSIDACLTDGFHLNNGLKTSDGSGVLLVGGEAFAWRPWEAVASSSANNSTAGKTATPGDMLSRLGTLDIPVASSSTGGGGGAWGVLDVLYPKPDLLIIGTGAKIWPISKATREYLQGLGLRVDVMDTGNAAAAYNLLATERGIDQVAAALFPVGWKGSLGKRR